MGPRTEGSDTPEPVHEPALHFDHVAHSNHGEIRAVRPSRVRIDAVGPGRAAATSEDVWADDEVSVRVDRFARPDGKTLRLPETMDDEDHYLLSAHLAAGLLYVIDMKTNRLVKAIPDVPGVASAGRARSLFRHLEA